MAADPLTSLTAEELLRDQAAFETDDEDLAQRPPVNAERDDKAVLSPRKRKAVDDLDDGLVEEEVKITKQRKKIPKLDTDKLLSEPGIPKMRSLLRSGQLKKKLRFRGKGHEFSDTARLLNYYQMWLDHLYPRAKFADAVQMVEKAGHTKKMQMYRKSWIDEGKPGHVRKEDVDEAFENQVPEFGTAPREPVKNTLESADDLDEDPASMFFGDNNDPVRVNNSGNGPDDDELDALLAQEDNRPANKPASKPIELDSEGEDDLDAMLAQYSSTRGAVSEASKSRSNGPASVSAETQQNNTDIAKIIVSSASTASDSGEEDEDELDALLAGSEQPITTNTTIKQVSNPQSQSDNEIEFPAEEDDFDDLDALMHNHNTSSLAPNSEPELPNHTNTNTVSVNTMANDNETSQQHNNEIEDTIPSLDNAESSSPIPDVHTDELDQLMDEHDAALAKKEQEEQKTMNKRSLNAGATVGGDVDVDVLEEFMSSSPIASGGH